ncbi:MAG: CDP-glycerol glycerophosphotransferase family protein, partial [Eubacterium sp.]|nr:CDP-glycerol glycerophosphotransferase family protein [Eubacterium sp.]
MNNLLDKNLIYAEVVDINWERINLYIDVKIKFNEEFDKSEPLKFYAVNGKFEAKAKFQATQISDTTYRLYLNITNTGYNSCLPRGSYTIVICQNNNEIAHCMTAPSIVNKMNDFSRSFLFANRSKTYVVVFFVDDTDEYALPFIMYTMAAGAVSINKTDNFSLTFSENKENREVKTKDIPKKKKARKKIFNQKRKRKILKKLYELLLKINYNSKNTILFMSEQNKEIGGNLKAVSDRMIERKLDKEYKLLYSFRSSVAEKQNLKSWFVFLNKLSKSTMIFMDDHAPVMDWLDIHSKTKIIQLWHAGAGFKSSGYSRWGNKGCPSPYSCHRQYDYGISGSKNISHFFSEVWGINTEQVLPTGMPRIDQYLNADYRKAKTEELYELYPMCKGKKVILFAPTYRGKNKADAHYPYELIDFEKLYNLCADEYVVLFKMHPWVSEPIPIPEAYADKFFDVGAY